MSYGVLKKYNSVITGEMDFLKDLHKYNDIKTQRRLACKNHGGKRYEIGRTRRRLRKKIKIALRQSYYEHIYNRASMGYID